MSTNAVQLGVHDGKTGQMITLATFGRRGPPSEFKKVVNKKTSSQNNMILGKLHKRCLAKS